MNLNERGFVGIISLILSLAIIYLLMSFLLKSLTGTAHTTNGAIENPQGIMQSAKEQVSQVNKIAVDRANALLNITDQK
jgi:hypothetical protein